MKKALFSLFIIFTIGQINKTQAQNGVGINTTSPKSSFEINGSFGQNITTITTNTTLDATQGLILCNNGSTAITITLPTVSDCTGRIYNIKREITSTANVTISGTIDGAVNLILKNPGESVTIFSNGTEWKTMLNYNSSSTSSSAWTTTGNTGTNPATNFLGTIDNKDLIIKTYDTTRIKTTATGVTSVGDITGGNKTTFEADGTIKHEGNATIWNDIMVFPDATSKGSSNPPTWTLFKQNAGSQGTWLWMFSPSTEQEVYFTIQIPHGYKLESTLYPHVHWTTTTGTPDSNVTWALEYTTANIGNTFSNTTELSSYQIIGAVTPAGTGQHMITSLGEIPGTGLGISSIIVCRLFRKIGDVKDTFANSVGLLGFDIHYELDTEGSRQEYIK